MGTNQQFHQLFLAYSLGAEYVERHITLDRSMWGTDQAASLSKDGMLNLVRILKKSSTSNGYR